MSKRSNACEFSKKARQEIYERDNHFCIFCQMGYRPSEYQGTNLGIAHYISRASSGQGAGLGIPQNGVLACGYHHEMMDNGANGHREEMLGIVRGYLKERYPGWNEEDLVYRKW